MRRVLTFALGLLIAGSLYAQHPVYEHFKEVRNAQDTTAMKSILDAWEQEEPERYAAWAGYCSVMAELTEDTAWNERGLQWAEEGLKAFPENVLLLYKKGEAQGESGLNEDALATFLHICDVEENSEDAWFHLVQLYALKRDLDTARIYAEKLSHSEDEDYQRMGTEVMESVDAWYKQFEEERITPDFQALRSFAWTADYMDLKQRFQACDTTLTVRDVSNLYYANGFRSDTDAASHKVSAALKPLLDERKFQEAFDLLTKALETEPLCLDVLFSAVLLCEPLQIDEETTWRLLWKLSMVEAAISVSGTGLSEGDPVYVNGVQDEYSFLQAVFGMQGLRKQFLTAGQHDCLIFVNGEGMDETIYFALSPAYWERLDNLYPDDE